MKEFTAESFNKQPAIAYRAADLGEAVTITHSRYPDKVFQLTAIDVDFKWTPVTAFMINQPKDHKDD